MRGEGRGGGPEGGDDTDAKEKGDPGPRSPPVTQKQGQSRGEICLLMNTMASTPLCFARQVGSLGCDRSLGLCTDPPQPRGRFSSAGA